MAKQSCQELMDKLPTPKPMWASEEVVKSLHQAFPWADPDTLAWVTERLRFLAHNLIDVLEEKFKPKLLHPRVRSDFEQTMVDVLLNYLRDDMELWVKTVKQNDLITASELMEFGK
jgi:hypothetical protein